MNADKRKYLQRIRANTAYSAYRSVIGFIAALGYILAALTALGGVVAGGMTIYERSFAPSVLLEVAGGICAILAVAALIYVLVRFWKEAALILADIGDSVTDANAKQPPKTQA